MAPEWTAGLRLICLAFKRTSSGCRIRLTFDRVSHMQLCWRPVSSEISDFTPCAHAQSNIVQIKYAEKTDDKGLVFR